VRDALLAQPPQGQPRGFDAWGIGLYQGGDVLLKRRPQPTQGPIDFYAVASELRTDTFIAHARAATVGDNRNENTHPFRFRSWLFAHHGTLPGFGGEDPARPSPRQMALADALRAEIPEFLLRNLHGQTDSELLFHLFLTRLYESNHLDADVRLVDAQAALHRTGVLDQADSPLLKQEGFGCRIPVAEQHAARGEASAVAGEQALFCLAADIRG